MINQQQLQKLPLFLHTLEEKGFVLLAERYDLVLQIAQRSADLEELKLRLSALLSSTPQQQRQFTECFEQFFNPIIAPFNAFLEQQERLQEEWRHMQNILNRQIERTVQESSTTKPKRSFYTLRNFLVLLGLSLISLVFLNYAGFGLEAYIGSLALLVSFVFIAEGYRFFRNPERPYTLRREAIAPPSSFFDIHIPTYAEVRFGRAFQGIARRLRQRLPTDQPVLDVTATIRKSIVQGGFFTPQYQYRSKAPAYLLLIDQSTVANHRFQLAELLHNWLLKQDIEVERFWYRNDPRTCWNEAHPSGIPLEQLPQRYAESQLLLFGDGWQLLNPASQKLQPWARAFAQWENRTLVTPIAPPAWTRKETQLAQLFMLAPASVEGLRYWSESMLPQTEQNSPKVPIWHEKAVFITKENFLTALHQHFPNELLREWLCALACFPVLNWELTLRIGAVLSQKHGTYLLDYTNLRRLTRISWFYNGYIPEEMRKLLYQQLDPTIAKLIHQCIVQILAEQVEDGRQHFNLSQRELALQIAVQQVAAGIVQAKDLVKYVWKNNSSTGNQDFLVLKHFYSAAYNIKVPDKLVKLLQLNKRFRLSLILNQLKDFFGIPKSPSNPSGVFEEQIPNIYQQFYRELIRRLFNLINPKVSKNGNIKIIQEKIRTFIENDEIENALQLLEDISPNNSEIVALRARFIDLMYYQNKGVISKEEYIIGINKIVSSVLWLTDQLTKTIDSTEVMSKPLDILKTKSQIYSLIARNRIEEALQVLTNMSPNNREIVALRARFNDLMSRKINGALHDGDYEIAINQIIHNALMLSGQLTEAIDSTEVMSKPLDILRTKDQIYNLIARNKIEEALQVLTDVSPNNQEIVVLRARFNDFKSKRNEGIFSFEDIDLSINQIVDSMLTLTNEITESRDLPDIISKPSNVPQKNEKTIKEVKNLISRGNLEYALQLLKDISPNNSEIVVLRARFIDLMYYQNKGVISKEEYIIGINKIMSSVLRLTDQLTEAIDSNKILSQPKSSTRKKVFIAYSRKDSHYMDELSEHLSVLERKGKITIWSDKGIEADDLWEERIKLELQTADIVLVLVSYDFLASDYRNVEIKAALERHQTGEAKFVPIVIRHCDWSGTPFAKINGLPSNNKPVSSYSNRDKAWLEVVKRIETLL